MKKSEYIPCPVCGACISVIDNRISRHEYGLGYVPYMLYRKIERISGTSIKEQAKKNLCNGSGKQYNLDNSDKDGDKK